MAARSGLLRAAVRPSRPRFGGFGSPRDHEPLWIENWNKDHRAGKDSLDWFFRAFNATGIYEVFLKSSPRFYGFMVGGGIIGGQVLLEPNVGPHLELYQPGLPLRPQPVRVPG